MTIRIPDTVYGIPYLEYLDESGIQVFGIQMVTVL